MPAYAVKKFYKEKRRRLIRRRLARQINHTTEKLKITAYKLMQVYYSIRSGAKLIPNQESIDRCHSETLM